jgi:hypothetical protein
VAAVVAVPSSADALVVAVASLPAVAAASVVVASSSSSPHAAARTSRGAMSRGSERRMFTQTSLGVVGGC